MEVCPPLWETLAAAFPPGVMPEGLGWNLQKKVRRKLWEIGYRVQFPPGEDWRIVVEHFALAGVDRIHRGFGDNPWFWLVEWQRVFGAAAVEFWPEVGTPLERHAVAMDACVAHLEAILIARALNDVEACGALPDPAVKGLRAVKQSSLPALPRLAVDEQSLLLRHGDAEAPGCGPAGGAGPVSWQIRGSLPLGASAAGVGAAAEAGAAAAAVRPGAGATGQDDAEPAGAWARYLARNARSPGTRAAGAAAPAGVEGAGEQGTAPVEEAGEAPQETELPPAAHRAQGGEAAAAATAPGPQEPERRAKAELSGCLEACECGEALVRIDRAAEVYGGQSCAVCDQCLEPCGLDSPGEARKAAFLHCAGCHRDLCAGCESGRAPAAAPETWATPADQSRL